MCHYLNTRPVTTSQHAPIDEKCKKNQLLAPEIMRVLTELFLTVENLAQVKHIGSVMCLSGSQACRLPFPGAGGVPGPAGGDADPRGSAHLAGEGH